ncbi:MAG: 3-oxoacyl-[acyl-carrier-protein] reductase [Alphaproteobacteria bacterium]|nr:3-oxoacyl-[acyl-carrier-protein] reductase [Alphaproteobacteria bacterium]
MLDLTGKTALITGATGGIGRAIAKTLHAQGTTLALTDMNLDTLNKFASELKDRVFIYAANLSDGQSIANLVSMAEKDLGHIDILVNNAGITKDTLSMRMSDEQWDDVLRINLTAGFKLARSVIPSMMKNRWGRIISMASIVGVIGNAGQANYAASKAGLIAMSKSMAAELAGRNITVNCIAPGFIATPMTANLPEDVKKAMMDRIPAKRMGEPQDIANLVAFLASEEAAYITGQTVNINGGMLML